jgi:hypothetical protein
MCPFNSQNTVFLQEALWGLLLPVTTTMRVCDIWRGYWAQRLLWEIGGKLCFIPPTVIQHRNVHTLGHDYLDELDLYKDAGRLVDFLRDWSFGGSSFPEAVMQLSRDMAKAGFWLEGDADLAAAWVEVSHSSGRFRLGRFGCCALLLCEWQAAIHFIPDWCVDCGERISQQLDIPGQK